MANHVHAIFDYSIQIPEESPDTLPSDYKQVHEVMKLINGATAVQGNRILKRSGKFWAEGYFDRFIRDERHLFNSINYTLYNPVKVGICEDWRDYPFSFLANGFEYF
jgi:putative transposase